MRRALATFALVLVACSRDEVPVVEAPQAPAPPPIVKPVDHLAPNELLEGTEQAFGLVLPRGARIDHAFVDATYVTVHAPIPKLVEYFKARVRDGSFTTNERAATFSRVKIPAHPGSEFDIRIEGAAAGTQIVLRDVSRPSAPSLPDDEARWRAVGMSKDGKLLDPNRMQ